MKYVSLMAMGVSSALLLSACSMRSETTLVTPSATPVTQESVTTSASSQPTGTPAATPQSTPQGKQNIVVVMKQRAELSKAVSFLASAKMETTLQGPGPFTVFAPSNQGITKADQKVLADITAPGNADKLVGVLNRHIVPGTFYASDLYDGLKLRALDGAELLVTKKDDAFYVNGKQMTAADINASNGVVHVLDGVITE